MQNKTALIVDDSRTASQMLRLMLEREQFQVDVLGSAEDAIGYLRDHRPGIIFMDHIMPGMDGFQAVKEIKNSSLTSAIPIVMYTAKSGDLYVGQAHALGAVDILQKPPTKESLRAVFRRLDQRSAPQEAAAPAEEPTLPTTSLEPADSEGADYAAESPGNAETVTARAVERPAPPPSFVASPSLPTADAVPEGSRVSWWLAAVLAAAAFAGGMQFSSRTADQSRYWETLAWALNAGLEYPYGEWPFAGERVAQVRGLVEHLAAVGFRGTVRLEGHAGAYCLVAGPGGWRVPDGTQPIEACEIIGLPEAEARQMSGLQSPEFREFMQKSPLLAQSGIRIQVDAKGMKAPRHAYPAQDQVASVGDWNRIAAENNRISLSLVPDP